MKVLVAAIAWRNYEAANMFSIMNLLTHPEFTLYPVVGDALIERSRSRAATYFLEQTDADVLLSIDSDIDFRDTDMVQLCEQAMEHSIVAGIYVTRSKERGIPTSRLRLDVRYEFATDPTPIPIEYMGGGCMAVHRRVFERLAEEHPDCRDVLHADEPTFRMRDFYWTMRGVDDNGKLIKLSEDWAFSERARQVGFETYCNPAVRLGHWGVRRYTLEDLYAVVPPPSPLAVTRTREGHVTEHN